MPTARTPTSGVASRASMRRAPDLGRRIVVEGAPLGGPAGGGYDHVSTSRPSANMSDSSPKRTWAFTSAVNSSGRSRRATRSCSHAAERRRARRENASKWVFTKVNRASVARSRTCAMTAIRGMVLPHPVDPGRVGCRTGRPAPSPRPRCDRGRRRAECPPRRGGDRGRVRCGRSRSERRPAPLGLIGHRLLRTQQVGAVRAEERPQSLFAQGPSGRGGHVIRSKRRRMLKLITCRSGASTSGRKRCRS